jgi:PmbA protein
MSAKQTPMEFAQSLVAQAIAAGAGEAQVFVEEKEYFEIQSTSEGVQLVRTNLNDTARLTVIKDQRKGEASLNGREKANIAGLIEDALQSAGAGMADEANHLARSLPSQTTSHGKGFPDKEIMISSILEHLQAAGKEFPKVRARGSGVAFTLVEHYFINSHGIQQEERRGYYDLSTMFSGQDGTKITSFNAAGISAYELPESLLSAGVIRRVMDETSRSFDAHPMPGKFVGDVIITPECLASLLFWMVFGISGGALNGHGLLSKTSPFVDAIGKQIASRGFTMRNQPRSEVLPKGSDFDEFGVPSQNIDIIQDGILKNYVIDYYTSQKLGMPQTAGPINLVVDPGTQTLAELIEGTQKGILFARFSGNYPNAQLEFSGIAKNSFYIENGKIQYPLAETMVSGSLKDLIMNIRGISKETVNFGDGIYPYLAASGITISSK